MPFKSKAQRRKFAELLVKGEITPETYEEWNRETGDARLPERVKPKARRTATSRTRSKARRKTGGAARSKKKSGAGAGKRTGRRKTVRRKRGQRV
jgi:hypothetical protein